MRFKWSVRNDFKFDLVLVCRNGGYDVVVGTVIKAKVQDKKGNIHDKKDNWFGLDGWWPCRYLCSVAQK